MNPNHRHFVYIPVQEMTTQAIVPSAAVPTKNASSHTTLEVATMLVLGLRLRHKILSTREDYMIGQLILHLQKTLDDLMMMQVHSMQLNFLSPLPLVVKRVLVATSKNSWHLE
jgi:hypothetical protein